MGVETENNEIAAKGFENTDFVVCILVVWVSSVILPVGYLKGRYKSESSLMTCEAELHGLVTWMPSSILSLIGTCTIQWTLLGQGEIYPQCQDQDPLQAHSGYLKCSYSFGNLLPLK